MLWRFTITHPSYNGGAATIVEEPIGWDEAIITLARDEKYHGVNVEYSFPVKFIGDAAQVMMEIREQLGIDQFVEVTVEHACPPGYLQKSIILPDAREFIPVQGGYATVFRGRINLGGSSFRYEDGLCTFEANIEQDGNWQTLRSRIDAQVDLLSTTGIDGGTLNAYARAPYDLTLLPQTIVLQDVLKYQGSGPFVYPPVYHAFATLYAEYVGGVYTQSKAFGNEPVWVVQVKEIGGAQDTGLGLQRPTNLSDPFTDQFISPTGEVYQVYVSVRYKIKVTTDGISGWSFLPSIVASGTLTDAGGLNTGDEANGTFVDTTGSPPPAGTYEYIYEHTGNYDFTISATRTASIEFTLNSPNTALNSRTFFGANTTVQIELEKFIFDIRLNTSSAKTTAKVVMINEAFARMAEALTNNKVSARSLLLGLVSSEPYPQPAGQVGEYHNLTLTNGLLIRRIDSTTDNDGNIIPTPLQTSMEELLDATNKVLNIGYDLEDFDNTALAPVGEHVATLEQILRVEKSSYFYQPWPVALVVTAIREYTLKQLEKEQYTNIKAGYEKAEIEGENGLYEFNTPREWQTNLKYSNAKFDIRCKYIASGYLIEKTRRIDETRGSVDTQYDNNVFWIAVSKANSSGTHPDGEAYTGLTHSERAEAFSTVLPEGNLLDGYNRYNLRLAPRYNILRWINILLSGAATTDLTQTYYEGNNTEAWYPPTADGTVSPAPTGGQTDFDKGSYATGKQAPFYQPLELTFEYPLSWAQYILLRQRKYNPIQVTNSGPADGYWWMREVQYRPAEGMAEFTLIRAIGDCLGVEPTFNITLTDPDPGPLVLDPHTAGGIDTETATFSLVAGCCSGPYYLAVAGALPEEITAVTPALVGGNIEVAVSSTDTPPDDDVDLELSLTLTGCNKTQPFTLPVRVLAIPFAFNNAWGFDGVNDYVRVPGAGLSSLFGTADFALSTWVYPSSTGRWIFENFGGDNRGFNLSGAGPGGSFAAVFYYGTASVTIINPSPYTLNTWYHIVVQRRSNNWELWVNGILVVTQPLDPTWSNATSDNLHIGARNNAGAATNPFNGRIDESTMYNKSLTPSEISYLYNGGAGKAPNTSLLPNLVARWNFDTATGTLPNPILADVSGNSNDGTGQNISVSPLVPH